MPAVRPETPVQGANMGQNNILHAQITSALACVRSARFDGDLDIIDAAEHHLDALLDRLLEVVPV